MVYLLDTSVYSQPLKNRPSKSALARWMSAGDAMCVTCEACLAEVEYGLHKENNPQRFAKFSAILYRRIKILPINRTVWSEFSHMKAKQDSVGRSVHDLDLLIAAAAVHHGLILATLNARHFRDIDRLRWEDWSKH